MGDMPTSQTQREAEDLSSRRKRGGWISFPFIIGTVAGMSLTSAGIIGNLIVYLIGEFNIKSISAAQISNVVVGSSSLFPFLAAIIADSFFGSFPVALLSSFASFLSTIILTLTATINSLRPHPCKNGSNPCEPPSNVQYAILYLGLTLAALGFGVRLQNSNAGTNQFEKPEHQGIFFNWFFLTCYFATVLALTGLIYVQDSVSWALGFGISALTNLIAVVVLSMGFRFYRPEKPQGSAFLDLVRVFVAAICKWKFQLSSETKDYYCGHSEMVSVLSKKKFFNHAALITDGDIQSNGSIKPWRLCTIAQVEDFKTVISILPLWSSSIFLSTPIGILSSLVILQALATNRHLGPNFKIPVGSILVILLLSTSIFLTLLDRFIFPLYHKLIGKSPTPLQRIGVGYMFNVIIMVVSALVESKRLKIAQSDEPIGPMSVLWLFPQLVLCGIGEAFHFPGQVSFYYQQLPHSFRSTSTAMISMILGIAYYLSTAIIDQVRRSTNWLPSDVNHGRMDNVYWMLVVLGGINFGYYLICSTFYKYDEKV